MSETTELTAKLEEAIADAQKGCLYPARCEHCAAVGALAAEVLAGRKRETQAREALRLVRPEIDEPEEITNSEGVTRKARWCHGCQSWLIPEEEGRTHHRTCIAIPIDDALAALEVPDGE